MKGPSSDSDRSWRRRLLTAAGSVSLLMVSLVVTLLLAEGLVRAVAPQQLILVRPDIWRPTDVLGWEQRPEVDTRVNTGERTVRFVTDHRGFRVAPSGPAEGDTRILLLGDSYMAALQVDYARSLAGLIESELPSMIDQGVTVHNSSVGAWDASHYRIRARELLEEYSYDLVLVGIYLGNDLVHEKEEAFDPRHPAERHRIRLPRELSVDEAVEALARPVNDWLEVRSHLFVLARNSLESALMRLGLTARYMPFELQVEHRDSAAWDITADVLADIHSRGLEEDVPILFFFIPSNYQVYPELLRRHARALGFDPEELDPKQPNRLLGTKLRENGLRLVDLLSSFRSAAADGAQLYGEVDPHFSPEGHRATWRAIQDEVRRALDGSASTPDGASTEDEEAIAGGPGHDRFWP